MENIWKPLLMQQEISREVSLIRPSAAKRGKKARVCQFHARDDNEFEVHYLPNHVFTNSADV